jgi:hypothetical protein
MFLDIFRASFTGPTLYKIFSFCLLVMLVVWAIWGTKISQHKEQMKDKQIESIQETVETTEQLISKQLEQTDSANYSRLIQKYPLGYCLFAVDHRNLITPYESRLDSDYEIDWSTAEVTKISSDSVVIRLPSIHDKIHHIELKTGIAIQTTRQVGSVREYFGGHFVQIFSEVIANDEKGVIIALGFKESEIDKK